MTTPPAPGRAEGLLACPWCPPDKSAPRMWPPTCDKGTPYNPADRAYPVVRCGGCHVEVPGKDWDRSGQSAINAWNRRPAPAIVAEVVRYQPAKDTHGVFLHEIGNTGKVAYAQPVVLASAYDAALRTLAEVRGELALREQTIASLRGAVAGAQADLAEVRGECEKLRSHAVEDGQIIDELENTIDAATQQAQAAYQVFRDIERKLEAERDAANELRNQIAAENKRLFAKNLEATQRAEQAEAERDALLKVVNDRRENDPQFQLHFTMRQQAERERDAATADAEKWRRAHPICKVCGKELSFCMIDARWECRHCDAALPAPACDPACDPATNATGEGK